MKTLMLIMTNTAKARPILTAKNQPWRYWRRLWETVQPLQDCLQRHSNPWRCFKAMSDREVKLLTTTINKANVQFNAWRKPMTCWWISWTATPRWKEFTHPKQRWNNDWYCRHESSLEFNGYQNALFARRDGSLAVSPRSGRVKPSH